MEKQIELDLELEGVSCSIVDNYGLVKVKTNVFEGLTDLQHDEKIFRWIDRIEAEKDLTGILIINEPGSYGCKAYNAFLSNVSGKELNEECPEKISKFEKSQIRAIEVNMLMTFIKKFVNFPKLIVNCLRGEIVTPFIGLTLVADYRFFTESTFYNFVHAKYGIHPSGGLPFLLPKFIGQGRAEDLLLQGGKINADDAVVMGLVNGVLHEENFEEQCKDRAEILFATDRNVVKSTKDLLFNYKKELYNYFEQEANYMYA